MRNFFKRFGIIALVAVIGFSMTACDDGSGDNNNNSGNNNSGDGTNVSVTIRRDSDKIFFVDISGATWKEFGTLFDEEKFFDATGNAPSGNASNYYIFSIAQFSSYNNIRFRVTVSKRYAGSNGTIILTPKATISHSDLSYYANLQSDKGPYSITGPVITMTFTDFDPF
jgi:hypothetical protein